MCIITAKLLNSLVWNKVDNQTAEVCLCVLSRVAKLHELH